MSGLWLQDFSARLGELGLTSRLQLQLGQVPLLTGAALAVTLLLGLLAMHLHRWGTACSTDTERAGLVVLARLAQHTCLLSLACLPAWCSRCRWSVPIPLPSPCTATPHHTEHRTLPWYHCKYSSSIQASTPEHTGMPAQPAPISYSQPAPDHHHQRHRRRSARPRHDLDLIPGPWRSALPLLGNILEVLTPDFHRKTLQWADEHGGFTR